MSDKQVAKNIMKEIQKIYKMKNFFDDADATIEFDRNNYRKLKIIIVPKNGPFKSSLVCFEMEIGSEYPNKKPTVKSLSRIYHPNVSGSSKKVCFSMFSSDWSSSMRILDYINGLIYFLLSPNHDDPFNSSCVERNAQKFEEKVQKAALGGMSNYDTISTVDFEIEDSQDLRKKYKKIMVRNQEEKNLDTSR